MNDDSQPQRDDVKELLKPPGFLGLRVDRQSLIKHFFSGAAGVTIITLFLIMWSLLREGTGFLPTYRWELSVYRQAGLEYSDYIQKPLSEHEALTSRLRRAYMAELATINQKDKDRRDAALLAKAHVEDKAILAREALEEALQDTTTAPDKIASLRSAVNASNANAVASEPLPDIFTADEKTKLKAELTALQPDVTDIPPFIQSLNERFANKDREAKAKYAAFSDTIDTFEEASEPIVEIHDEMKDLALTTKKAAEQRHMAEDEKAQLLKASKEAKTEEARANFSKEADAVVLEQVDFKAGIDPLLAKFPAYQAALPAYKDIVSKAIDSLPKTQDSKDAKALLADVRKHFPEHLKHVDQSVKQMQDWKWDKKIPTIQALTAFLFGGDWITNSSWQDFYGVVPLFTGSLLIAITALVIALPLSVMAAIYVNQFASQREQDIIKPIIEFIQAIPSVVLGFIGISVVGDLIKDVSNVAWLQWIPGFPVAERLNMFNAGLLLALMAIPTMFSLAEDAIQNVPRSFSEASEALGATKLQTVLRVIFPASISGVFAAMLLGLGRIIGETMVVLLVAGNRIAIPNFSDGIGAVFQPAHTLTGIIAQELGEVSRGSSHWQALFMVGILLFAVSLLINYVSRKVVKKFALPKI